MNRNISFGGVAFFVKAGRWLLASESPNDQGFRVKEPPPPPFQGELRFATRSVAVDMINLDLTRVTPSETPAPLPPPLDCMYLPLG